MDNIFSDLPKLYTERLILRKLTINDSKDIFLFTSNEKITEFLSWSSHKSETDTKQFLKSVLKNYELNIPAQWGIELREEKKIIGIAGFISFSSEHNKGEIAYILSPYYQNKGYMTEALKKIVGYSFNDLGLVRLSARCEIDNFASEKVMQKIGMTQEGIARKFLIRRGDFRDYKFYSTIKSEK